MGKYNWRNYKENFQSKNHDWIPSKIYVKLKQKTNNCERCYKPLTWNQKQIHHKIPVSKGGNNDPNNLMIVCKECHKVLDKKAGVYYEGWQQR